MAAYVIPAGWPRRLSQGFWGNGTGQRLVIDRGHQGMGEAKEKRWQGA